MPFTFSTKTARALKEHASPARVPYAGHYLHASGLDTSDPRSRIPATYSDIRSVNFGEFSAFSPGIFWAQVETSSGTYDWSWVRAWLQECTAKQMFLVVNFLWKSFNVDKGDVMPEYLVAQGYMVKGGTASGAPPGFCAGLWHEPVLTAVKAAFANLYATFGDHPWFAGVEFPESSGIETTGNAVRWANNVDGYVYVNTVTPSAYPSSFNATTYETHYGELIEYVAGLRGDLLVFPTTNTFPSRGGTSGYLTGYKNIFDQVTSGRSNVIAGGPDILFEADELLTSGINLYGYPCYYTNSTRFYSTLHKCSMQHDSHKSEENGGIHVNTLWRWARDKLNLSVVQWNYQTGAYTYTHSDALAAIEGTTPVSRYSGGDFSVQSFVWKRMSSTGVKATSTWFPTSGGIGFTLCTRISISVNTPTTDQTIFKSTNASGDWFNWYIKANTRNPVLEVKRGGTTVACSFTSLSWNPGSQFVIACKWDPLYGIYQVANQISSHQDENTSATARYWTLGNSFEICTGANITMAGSGFLVYHRAIAGDTSGSGIREFEALTPSAF